MFGLFDKLKKGKETIVIGAPVEGEVISITQVADPVFSQEVLGKGIAILPVSGQITAPADGVLSAVFETGHAFSMTTGQGVELLVHVGLDTVQLKGEHFQIHRQEGDRVKQGDLILTADLEAIQAAGYDTVTPMVVCNSDEYTNISGKKGPAKTGDVVLEIQG